MILTVDWKKYQKILSVNIYINYLCVLLDFDYD